jgi:hypothetical protein
MTLFKPTLLTYLSCPHSPVADPLCPTPRQNLISTFNSALAATAIHAHPHKTEPLATAAAAFTAVSTNIFAPRTLTIPIALSHHPIIRSNDPAVSSLEA